MCLLSLAVNCLTALAFTNPYIAPGNLGLRHDIQLLADYGVIAGTVTSWPLSWGAIISDMVSLLLAHASWRAVIMSSGAGIMRALFSNRTEAIPCD